MNGEITILPVSRVSTSPAMALVWRILRLTASVDLVHRSRAASPGLRTASSAAVHGEGAAGRILVAALVGAPTGPAHSFHRVDC